jgi:hypothetical protein
MEVIMGFQRDVWAHQEQRTNKAVLISKIHFSIVLNGKMSKRMLRSQFIESAFMTE